MRYLAIDVGDKRTGLAVGDDDTGIVSPAGMLEVTRGERLLDALVHEINQHCPDALVVGLPLNMDDTEGDAAKAIRIFGNTLQRRTALPVHFQDERLTSYAADQHLSGSGRTHKQKRSLRDALAAAEILRDFLASSCA